MNFNKSGSIDFSTNKKIIEDYIYTLDNFKDIQTHLGGGTIDLLTNIVAGYTSYITYKMKMLREETHLQRGKLESSVFESAFPLGYRFQRNKAPEIKLKYISSGDVIINTGDKVGYVEIGNKKYDLIYFGLTTKLKNNDDLIVVIGKYFEIDHDCKYSKVTELELKPKDLECIDNDNIIVYNNGMYVTTSNTFESYILNGEVVNWSKSTYDCMLYVDDKSNNLGLKDAQNLQIKYIETDGYVEFIDYKKIKLNETFYFEEVYFNGLDKDSLDKIRKMAPALRTTKGRTVTLADYENYINNSNLFNDVLVERQSNIPCRWQISRDHDFLENEVTKIYIDGSVVTTNANTINDAYIELNEKLINHRMVKPRLVKNNNGDYELFIEQTYLARTIKVSSDDYDVIILNEFVMAPSCSLNIFYVKKHGVNKNVPGARPPLTTSELLYIDKYMKSFGMVGTKLMYIPAIAKPSYISMEIQLVDNKFQEEVYDFINKVIKRYEYKLSSKFESSYIISEIIKYEANDNGMLLRPVQFAKVLNADVDSEDYEYLTFFGIDITFR